MTRARLALLLFGLALPLLAAEAAVRAADLDGRALREALYYQAVELPLHQDHPDPALHYSLRPGARARGQGPYGPYTVTIGPEGDRGPGPPGAREVWVFGASTVFGVGVSDDQTLPAALGRALTAAGGQPVRARNFGVSAYVLPQMAALARDRLDALPAPDLIVLVHTNPGRRPFLLGAEPDPLAAFEADPDHWLENLPPPPDAPPGLHLALLRTSALYRLARASARLRAGPAAAEHGPTLHAIAERELAALEARAAARGVALAWALYPDGHRPARPPEALAARDPIDLFSPDLDPAACDLHPAPPWLAFWGERLAEALRPHLGPASDD